MRSIRSVYKIGSGPSSSHTVGPYRAARLFGARYPEAERFRVTLYGSLAFIPLFLFLLFGVWSIILCGNSLVWTICYWPESSQKKWNWNATLEDVHNEKANNEK